ncbi:DMSO/TMAO reductase YedYZ molybdopterin-dependent catalytic subunit [Paraburkholderia sp. GAS199]|uniref:molybdopterin-binding oxidoreductase n=1 Tax=Paraburkholderia sp. GAS199 TaxID=3035126 RepID=UPI003D2307F5
MRFPRQISRVVPLFLLSLLSLTTVSCGGGIDTPPPALSVSGDVAAPANLTRAQIQALPATTQTVSFASGTAQQTHVYTGASLWTLLNNIGITTNPAVKNDILAKYVVATGGDNYRSLFAMGEVDPDFGNRGNEVAYSETNNGVAGALPGTDGPLRVTAPGDVKGGRYVSNLVKLEVHSAVSTVTASGGGLSTSFRLLGAVGKPATFDLTALQALPVVTQTAGGSTYTGVSLWNLINAAGIQTNASVKNDLLGFYLIATGTDGYRVVISLAELSPDFGNQPDIIAYGVNGGSLSTNGFARLVIPNDGKAGRYVSNLVALEVVSAPR